MGTAVGWEVDQVFLCPGRAEVVYERTAGAWYADPLESFAGGFGGALFILAVYWLVFVRRDRPLRAKSGQMSVRRPLRGLGTCPLFGALCYRKKTAPDPHLRWSGARTSRSLVPRNTRWTGCAGQRSSQERGGR